MIDSISDLYSALPQMMSGVTLENAIKTIPDYKADIVNENTTVRLLALTELYEIYLPSKMTEEIYQKLYIALMRSLQKKGTKLSVIQQNENRKRILQRKYYGIMGGADCFTIIGQSGIGKSSTIERSIAQISGNETIVINQPFSQIIPCLIVQCPYDSSVKGMLLDILLQVDERIGTKYYESALRARATTDMLIGAVSQVSLNHVGMLIVDEIQNIVNNKNGKSLVAMLTQLINSSGISICMVGTPECTPFFEQEMQLARRSVGLQYDHLKYDIYFEKTCHLLLSYRYVKNAVDKSSGLLSWLYERSNGIIGVLIALIHDAQEIAILNGSETLNLQSLEEAEARFNIRLA